MSYFRDNFVSLVAVKFASRPVKTIRHTSVLPSVLKLLLGLAEGLALGLSLGVVEGLALGLSLGLVDG